MHAMQYEIPLPTDYDMGIIRRRVATRGAALDHFPGLGLKAYLIREHAYAPFYLWNDMSGMNTFLWGGGFANIIRDFGRPPVRQWTGLAFARGPASEARTATRLDVHLPDGDPSDVIRRAIDELVPGPDVHSAALVIDTHHWVLTRFTLGGTHPGTRYEVLHLSTPGLDEIH
ncbi:DUF4865 family protein [Cryptosporangium arvum]|uniref:DUF4865 domain-containing protein n=1 Tax=Cryptosporangium arvum DSM 44712 TaxID=927661 RepID=A0A010ZWJ8_9ACTN|nr:DUF4865 family protein [Cryptosporangium arvum]EXG81597.1 hypothetical protein CryarDRAFT_2714 [Cryptosporangium arvum DSM 44712]